MTIVLIILLLSAVLCYAFCSIVYNLPYICLFPEAGIIVRMLNQCAIKWSIVFGIFGVVLMLYCLISKEYSSDRAFPKMPLLVFYSVLFVLTLL